MRSGGVEPTLLAAQRQELLRSFQTYTTQCSVLSAVVSIRCSWRCSSAAIKVAGIDDDPSQRWQTAAVNHTLAVLTPVQLAIWHLVGKRLAS